MPANKNAEMRYRILDKCFQKEELTIDELKARVEEGLSDYFGDDFSISTRQIKEDINFMRDTTGFAAPIKALRVTDSYKEPITNPKTGEETWRMKWVYKYSESDFSIYKVNLTEKDAKMLSSTIDMLNHYKGDNNGWLDEITTKLEIKFGFSPNKEKLVEFEQNKQLKGLEFLSRIIDATINHTVLSIKYKPFKGEEREFIFHPYYVKQYNSRWYIAGREIYYDTASDGGLEDSFRKRPDEVSVRALDRIEKISKSTEQFIPNDIATFPDYFNDIIGISYPKKDAVLETIKLKFPEERFKYIETKPLHSSQEIVDKDNCIITLKVKHTRDLDQIVLSYGPDVTVLSPSWYKRHIFHLVKNTLDNYKKTYNRAERVRR